MLENKDKIIPMLYDKMFKGVLESDEAREYLIDIISGIVKNNNSIIRTRVREAIKKG